VGDALAQPRRTRRGFWLWALFLTTCALLGFGKPLYDLHWRNRTLLYEQAFAAERSARQQARAEIWDRLWGLQGQSPAIIEAVLGLREGFLANVPREGPFSATFDGRELGSHRGRVAFDLMGARRSGAYPGRGARAAPDAAGWRVTLNFRDGHFVSAVAAPPPPLAAPNPRVGNALDLLARVALMGGPIVWLGGLLAGFVERRRASRFAEVALAGAIAATVAWSVRPGALTTQSGYIGVALNLVGVLVAVRVLRWLRRVERSRLMHFCYTCGYDLTGNVSGVCPECGNVTEAGLLRQRAEVAVAVGDSVAHVMLDEEEEPPPPEDEQAPGLPIDLGATADRTSQRSYGPGT
jgi:hypothetical protein